MKLAHLALLTAALSAALPASTLGQQALADSFSRVLTRLGNRPDSLYLFTQCKLAAAQLYFNPALADSTARVVLETARRLKFVPAELVALNLLGVAAQRQNRCAEAAAFYLPVIRLSQERRDTARWARTLNNLGLAYACSNDPAQAQAQFRLALRLQKDPLERAGVENNLGLLFKNAQQLDSALVYFHRALPTFVAANDSRGLADTYSNLGQVHLLRREFGRAELFFRYALDVDRRSGNASGEAITTGNLGVALLGQQAYRPAATLLRLSHGLAGQQRNRSAQHYAAENLYQLYERSGRLDSAYYWHKIYHSLQDSLTRREERAKLAEITSRYARDQRLMQAEQALLREQQRQRAWLGGTLALLGLLGLSGYASWQTRRRRQAEARLRAEELERLRAEQVLRTLREEELEAFLLERERVLASQSVQLLEKQKLLERVSDQLRETTAGGPTPEPLKPLLKLLQSGVQSDEQWETFKTQMEALRGGFFQRLLARQPRLTAHDLRYCAYLSMNLSSKEIAGLMNTSLRSVETQRYRLRRKLEIAPEQDLVAFLLQV